MKTRAKSNAFKFNKLYSINSINTRVRDKNNLLCQLPCSTSWRDNHFFNLTSLVQKAWYLIPNAPINYSVVRIFIVPKIRLLSLDDA